MTDAPLILWGRCRSGRRWFWAARDFDGPREHGWADSEELAVSAAEAAVERLAGGRAATVLAGVVRGRRHSHGAVGGVLVDELDASPEALDGDAEEPGYGSVRAKGAVLVQTDAR